MRRIIISCACLILASATVLAQDANKAISKVKHTSTMEKVADHMSKYALERMDERKEKDTTIIARLLTMNAPMLPEFNTNRLFTFTSKNQNYAFQVGALVKATASISIGDGDNSQDNDPKRLGQFPIGDNVGGNLHMSGSNIIFNFAGTPRKGHYVAAFVGLKVDQNEDYHPRLDHAYVRYNYLTVGKTSTTYDDNIASLFIIDGADAVASGGGGNMQISYQPIYKNWRFGVAIEQIRSSFTHHDLDKDYRAFQAIPDIPFYFSYEPSETWHIRLAGVLRGLRYNEPLNVGDKSSHTKFGWGAKLTGHWYTYPFKAFWQIQTGQGNASFFSANRDMNLDLVPDSKNPGRLVTPTHLGSTMGVQYNWKKNVYSVFRASYLRNWIDRYEGGDIEYNDHNQHFMNANLNVLWEVNKLMTCGAEYSYCARETNAKKWFDNHSFMTMAFISF